MKDKEKLTIREKVSDILDIPKELLEDIPKIIMTGNKQIYIENYQGIIEYTETEIKINAKSVLIHLKGKNLCVKIITSEEIIITGRIFNINFLN